MLTVLAERTCGPAQQADMSAPNTAGDRAHAGSTVTERSVNTTSGTAQLTLALTMGYHDGPLFIVQKRRAPIIHGGTLGGKRRRRREAQATPKWLTPWQRAWIRALYREAARLTLETGELYVVDHIVPLEGKIVCGLHVSWNMRVTHWRVNAKKGWGTWPDMPFDQKELL